MQRRAVGLALLGALLLTPGAAAGQARRQATVLMSENEGARRGQEEWGYSDAVVAGDSIYLSGIVVGLREGETDLAAAYDRAYRHIGEILRRAGASWDDVVDITSYHTDVTTQMEAIVSVHRRYVTAPFPAWTAIDVDRLIPDRGITEIKIVARRPAPATTAN
ncbi:Rid family hydrolase [Sphingosinicella terrae]|uniref:Rid family hydrolase n=1 Tax=Sphingosinicella terrae TaxID=2172047 RepID=UPI0013B39E73|nr:Rid family hydrolase [Sphingosinicella terrae]